MQLLNSNIPQSARITKYSNKKAQDLLNLVLFYCVAFSYYKDGGTSAPEFELFIEKERFGMRLLL